MFVLIPFCFYLELTSKSTRTNAADRTIVPFECELPQSTEFSTGLNNTQIMEHINLL